MNLENKIEAILFWKGEAMEKSKLASTLGVSKDELLNALSALRASLENRGVKLVEKDGEVMLGTAPELSSLFEEMQKEELNKTLSKSSLETLSIILYKNGATRVEIDYIRGVNSSFTLRALSVRGLIERVEDENDKRRFVWRPTFDLLSFMGVGRVEDLPDFTRLEEKFANIEEEKTDEA